MTANAYQRLQVRIEEQRQQDEEHEGRERPAPIMTDSYLDYICNVTRFMLHLCYDYQLPA